MDQVRGRRRLSAYAGCARGAIAALSLAFLLLALGCSKPSATQARPASVTPAAATTQAQTRADAPAVATTTSLPPATTTSPAVAPVAAGAQPTSIDPAAATPTEAARLPKLIDLGAKTCIPCKKMAPILEELAGTQKAYFGVEFIDVRENPSMAKPYNIKFIPTQIFFDAQGRELCRHIGFYSRDEILAKWRALGVNVGQ